ncbi:MAG TPA: SDR family NAD(P)-dependent oxidoreductase [Chitinophaga sp.]|uniref:SDR family NAD(P)-dependent oxidoreductase n=1 Tax=Chitinophaga sp. TaxID=1869181 RepID=UPI002BCC9982|nr:SDR family NAD(P)-dependent oxidoreductase [Chitinophaga sp.]HVI46509.1 SDR family NAD(P)-dependent oxidoreductase [Chitinophaga sp.]
MQDAEADHDHIYGVIAGSGINQDGKTQGITAPSQESQMEVEREVYERFHIQPGSISNVEMHGTGTKLGDPIELEALSAVYREKSNKQQYCAIGSVKSNIGHAIAAAGVAGVQKVLLGMLHKQLPPTINMNTPNKNFNFETSPFYINTQLRSWKSEADIPLRAAVSSFGFSGTNAHLVIESYPEQHRITLPAPVVIVLSAQNAEQLKQYVSEIRNFLLERDVLPMEDIAFTLQTGRDDLAERVGFIAADRSELLDKLTAFVTDNKPVPDIFTGRTERHSQSQHAFQANEELKVLMQEWTVQKNYNKLLELWIKGFAVDWTLLYNRESLPFRVSLPLDPFRKEHYQVFLPDDVHTNADQQSDGYAQLHPLLHQNVSTLNRQRFRTIFTGEELFFCDHIIHNRRILPGVAYLEMVYEAVRQSTGWGDEISIVHISWQRPLIADGVMREVFIELKPVRENDITFEVYQELENRGQIIYVTGSAARQELQSAPMHNIAALQTTCKKGCFPSDTCYQLYREGGFEYGPALQAMEMLFAGQKFVLAKLVLPESLRQDINRHTLHPSLMDAALQAIIGLGLTGEETGVPLPGTAVPYKLDQLLIYKKCSPVMWAVIRPDDTNDPDISQYKVNIDICEESGYVCITLRGCHLKDVSHWADSASPHIVAVDSPVTKPADGEWQRNLLTAEILRLLTKELAGILKVNVSDLDPDAHFSECGLDSMLFSAFANRMNEIWNLEITPVIFYEYRSLGNLTKFLAAEYHHHFISLLPPSPISQRGPVPVSSPSAGMTDSRLQKKKQVRLATGSSQTGNVPVAIIGMAGRFPMADDLNEYWENIRAGKDCISETPADRWDWRTYADTLKSGLRWGGYMKGVKEFDPLFFNISPEEASYMDPQQRLLLMYTWKAIEDAGYSPYSLAGSKTAVFAGTALHDYRKLVTDAGAEIKGYYSTGLVSSIGPNRISYLLDLHGPSEPVETACSSSLVAVHKAAEVLVSGSCDLALAGGVNTLLSPELSLSFWKGGMTSPDGRCKTFSSSANGYVRGEGVAVIVLKRLEDAERDGDHIYGIIRGSTVSHGGHTNSLTAPSVNAQSEVIRDAYKRAGIDPRTVGYIEAHGTGTKLGDPIEINALKAAFQELYAEGGDAAVTAAHCGIGAVKSNIGHLELAAGIAGIVKVLLQLQHKTLVKSLHAESVNPLISLQNSPFYIVHQNVEWKPISDGNGNALPRRAGISSFGFGGVNAHIVLEEYTATPREVRPDIPFVIVLSAETQTCLHAYAALLIEMVEEGSVKERDLPRIAYTLQTGRPALKQRVAFIADSLSNLKKKLEWLISGVGEGNGIYCGQTGDHKQIHFLHTDDDWDVIVDTWISRGKYSKLLELWSKGANLSWHRLYPTEHPQRISLPGYPFAEEYCWIQDNSIVPEDRKLIPASRLHPLLHEDISTDGLQRFCTTFTGEEFYLKDHIINGKSVLPGVAYLEMARAAAQLSAVEIINKGTYVAIKNVAWIQPFFFNSVAGKVFVELAAGVSQNIPYLVYSEDKAGNKHKYHQGVIVTGNLSAAPIFDLPALQAKHCSGFTVSKEEYYRALEKAGLALGASHKCLDTLSVAENEVLAHIMLPTPLKEEAHTYIMHPALMDAALQGAMMLLIDYLPYQRITLQLPFSLEELIVYGNVNTDVWLTARFSTGSSATDKVPKLDISLINEQGNVLVSIKGFSALAINVADSGTGTLCFHPFWEAAAIVSKLPHTYKHRLIMLCEKEPSDSLTAQAGCSYITLWSAEESIDKKFKAYAGQALLAFQDLIKTYAENAVLVQLLITHDLINIGFSGLSGLLKTAEREHPGLQCQLIEIYDKEHEISLSKILDENSVYPEDKHIRYRGGERQVKRWKQIEETTSGTLPWKNDGVYLIIGGLSGIGLLFAEEIAHHAANVSLILVARSAPDDYAQQKMMSLQQLGATVEYRLGDIGNETAVATLFDHIRKNYGRLNGILHSAGVIKDSFIIRKTAWELQQVLATKVSGLVLLDRESRDFDLDIFVVFSSVTGALGNAGQADHAMANAFMDEYVSHYGEQHQQLLQQHDDAVLAEMTEIENRLPALLLRQLQSMQLFLDVHTGCTIEELKVHIGLSPLYHRWMRETLRILVNAGLLRSNGERYTLLKQLPGAEVLWKEWEEQCAVWVADPDLDAWARFVSITLRALPEILTARRPAVQIIFPGSSMVLAEGVYKNNCVFDYFNSLVGNYVVAYVNDFMRQKPRQKLRILEIGAGTGATSAYIFKKLQPYSQHIAEYCFTDISRAFLLHAENEYGPDYPYLTYHLFNVEEPVNAQSIGVETYDIVIAANVLHATSDIQLAIRNCCSTLKEGGLLLLIELRDKTVYQHLTFGLLEGWWLHQDTTLRIPGSPGLYPETWKRVLEEEGCCDVCFPANRMEMQVITAQKAAATPVPPFSAVYNDYCRCRQTVPETRMLSVNWPYWKEGKTLVDEQVQQKLLHQFGLLPMDARSGIQAFYRAVASGEPQVAVMHGNMGKIKTIFINSPEESSVPETEPVGPITDRLITEEKVTDYFRSFLSAALRLPIESVQNETPMEEYGIDSLMMIQLTNQLQQTFGPLPHTLFLEYPNLKEVSGYFINRYPELLSRLLSVESITNNGAVTDDPGSQNTEGLTKPEFIAEVSQPVTAPSNTLSGRTDIAIIGVAGSYPGAENIYQLWDNLKNEKDSVIEIPSNRWDYHLHFDEAKASSGKAGCKYGGFLENVNKFDPLFFNISPREAENMEPQERLFLQCAYETLEDAGYTRETLNIQTNGRVGVFVGASYLEYQLLAMEVTLHGTPRPMLNLIASIANRVSYYFDFKGPSMGVDTMCSSSLTALHLACNSIYQGDCEVAIAGGVNVSLHPNKFLILREKGLLSFKGRCRSFGKGGDGMVPAEGVGGVLLKPLSKAIEDGDNIYGVIKGTCISHGGKTNGYTVPNPASQQEIILQTLRTSGIDARNISYVEAHGTGTELGDPVEIEGLSRAFRDYTDDKQFCTIGSVKSNIGHCESAAGIAGLTKVLLQLRHRQLVPSLHAETLNPFIDFTDSPFKVQRQLTTWERRKITVNGILQEVPLCAGVSSFGGGGSNAHIVLQEFIQSPVPSDYYGEMPVMVILSAGSKEQLQQQAERLLLFVEEQDLNVGILPHLAYTLQVGRRQMAARIAFIIDTRRELSEKLKEFINGIVSAHQNFFYNPVCQKTESDVDNETTLIYDCIQQRRYTELLKLWTDGYSVDWQQLYINRKMRRISLPVYPFSGEHYQLTHIQPLSFLNRQTEKMMAAIHNIPVNKNVTVSAERIGAGNISMKTLQNELAVCLGEILFIPASGIDVNENFLNLGLDSILGVEWIEMINKKYNLSLPATRIYDYPTLREMAEMLNTELAGKTDESSPADMARETIGVAPDIVAMLSGDFSAETNFSIRQLQQELAESLGAVLYLPGQDIDTKECFLNLGLDSVLGVEWIMQINKQYELSLPATVLYDHTSVIDLAAFLETALRQKHNNPVSVRKEQEVSVIPSLPVVELSPVVEAERTVIEKTAALPAVEGIAIIGYSGQLPESPTPGIFWSNLLQGKDCISKVPENRWSVEAYYDPVPGVPGKTNCQWMGVLQDADKFDPRFFNISPADALRMDPQQRLFLAACWHCIEDAGINPASLSGNRCGVYVGCSASDYYAGNTSRELSAQELLGSSLAILSARISYLLNLKGPSLSIDTACSSSLVAITEACTNLASHTVELALAGGVSVLAGPSLHLMAGHAGMLSTSGRCHTFDQSADGFVPGEGVGVLLLKRLQDALRDGDPVHGVIRGWGINQDGKTNGITAPGVKSQAALEAEIYKKFGIDPETITMVETHGTATRLGDPIEVEALTTAFRSFTEKQRYCVLGSVKSNVGHLLAAAGVAGVLKILLALNEQILPPNSQFQKLNEHIRLEGSPFYINTKALPWSVPEGCLRRAAVSSFGFSGTNAHIVIEEFRTERIRSSMSVTPVLIVLSARNEDRLKAYVTAMAGYIKTHRELSVQDIAYTLQIGREEMEYRLAFVAATCDEIVEMFNRVATSDQFPEGAGIMTGNAKNQQEETNLLMHDEDAGILFRTWIEKGKLDKIGRLWVNGLDIDWRQLYKEHQPARLHLPGYPFARESYWIPSATIPNEIRAGVSGQLHQLLHTNTSVFGKQRFSSVFNGTEFFLKDHMVSGRKTLPGAACIEMVLTAYRQSVESIPEHSSICVEEIVWLRPLVVDGRAETVHVCLHAEGGRVKYEMYGESTTGNPLVYNSGFIAGSAEIQPVRLKPETRLNGCNSGYMTAEACYSLFSNVGLNYGASFRVVKEIFIGEREAVARLELPATMKDSLTSFILHPALLDAAFQSLIGLVPASHKAMVPVAAEKVKVFGGCSSAMWAVVRHSHNISLSDKSLRFDIDLYDENGTIQVSITGLSIMEVGIPKDDTFLMCPGWTKLLTGSNTMPVYHEHIVISCGLSAGIATAIEKELTGIRFITGPLYQGTAQDTFVAYAEWALDTVQQILKGRPEKRMLIQFMTETSSLLSPALAALLSTMTKEQPLCCGQLLEISSNESTDEIIDKLKEGREYPENLYMRCHHRQTEIRQWEEITGLSGSPEHCWKDNGVYLITGGAGGLAVIFVREIVQRVEKPVVILIGRTPLREEQQRYLQELQATGATVVYKQVDVCDRQAVEIMFSSIHNTYGKLNGILHTAGVKKDNFLSKKTTRELQQVLEPKVTGLINIDEASRWLNPDFLILFSSVAGALGNEGQADYAMGNAFMDTYAAYRNNLIVRGDVKGKTLSVNWPLWEDGGMQMNEQIKEWWRQRSGFLPLPSTSGVKALYQAMNTGLTQIMVLCGDKKEIIQKISRIKIILPPVRKEEKITPETIPDRTPSVEKLYLELREGLAGILSLSAEEIDIDENFLNIGFDSIMAMQWLQGINKNYGTDIMAPRVFDYPTIREFAGFLEREMIRMEEERRIGDRQLSKLDFVGDLLLKVQWGIVDIDIADQTLHQLISEKKHHGNG